MIASPTTKKTLGPPFLGCVSGMIIGVIPWTHRVLLAEDAPLSPLLNSLQLIAIMISRFLVMPAVSMGILVAGFKAGVIPYEELLWFVTLLEGCMPSAQNSVVILQMEERPDLAASMAKTLTTVYLLSAVPVALLLCVIMQFVMNADTIL